MAKGQIPTNREDLEALVVRLKRLSPKDQPTLSSGDVFALEYTPGGGFGDAVAPGSEPCAKRTSLATSLTRDAAKSKYGVAIASDGQVDSAATERLRADERARRLADAIAPISNGRGTFSLEEVHQIGDSLGIAFSANGDASWACVDCGHDLAAAKDNFKQGAALIQVNPSAVDAIMYPDPSDFSDVDFVMRQFLCPNCGTLLSVECCRGDDEPSFRVLIHRARSRILGRIDMSFA